MIRALFAATCLLAACSTGPGSPEMRNGASAKQDNQSAIIPDCKNVSESARVDEYITKFYLTTWGSAWTEGLATPMDGDGRITKAVMGALSQPVTKGDAILYPHIMNVKPYCRAYAASRSEVAEAVAAVMPKLGNKVLVSDKPHGVFQTELIDRQHPAAKWKDSYVITVAEDRENHTVVKILRPIWISRGKDPYNQALSDGHNEGWIFTQIADAVK